MIINHNLNAMNAQRNMSINTTASGKAMEKLSSGLRINRAGDDAAGLAISEKMRGQIRGLDQASRNSQDAISLIQTAEGALNETHSILQRMRELAVQSSTDTNTDDDRTSINNEFSQLKEEINRISNNTEFNTKKLLDGSFGTSVVQDNVKTTALDTAGVSTILTSGGLVAGTSGAEKTYSIAANGDGDGYELRDGATVIAKSNGTDADGAGNITFTKVDADGNDTGVVALSIRVNAGYANQSLDGTNVVVSGNESNFQIGANEGQTIGLGINNMSTTGLGVASTTVDTYDNAKAAITSVNDAIQTVSDERSKLGAMQNRLEHTINNLGTASENLTSAESRIRDVDMAKEMMNFSKNNILSQAAQAMLAQANSQPQGVLQLLR